MSGQSVSLGSIKTKVDIVTANRTDQAIPTGAVFAEVLLIGKGGGGGGGSYDFTGGGAGEGAKGWYRFPLITTTTYTCTIGTTGGAGGAGGTGIFDSGANGTNGQATTFVIKGGPSDITLTANGGSRGGGGIFFGIGAGGAGGAADITTTLLLFQSVAGDGGTNGGGGGGTGGGLGGTNADTTTPGIANTGGGGGGGAPTTAGKDGGSGYIQIIWYFNTNSTVKLSEVDSQSYLFTSPSTGYNLPAPLGSQAADVILIGGGGSGGNYSTRGGSGGGQGVISYSPIVIPQGSAVEIVEVKDTNTTSNPWYDGPAIWEENAPAFGNEVYWIWPQVNANVGATEGAYFVFYGIYDNTSTTSTSAYLSFGVDDYGSVILNGTTVISWNFGNASVPNGGFSNPSITLLPGKNIFIVTAINTQVNASIWLAVTQNTGGGGTVYYKTDNTWKWTMMYGITVGAGATTAATAGGDTKFTLNNMYDTSSTEITLPNTTVLTQFIAGGGVAGVNSNTAAVNSGTATIKKNTATVGTAATPNDTNTNTTGDGMIMYVSGAKGAGAVTTTGGNGGSFTGGTGGSSTVAPIAGQTNGGGGGGGEGSFSGSTRGANGGDGLALVTFYGGSISLPLSLYAVSTRTDIYTTGSSSSISIPTGAYILKLILIGGGGNGAAFGSTSTKGGGGGSGGLGMWIIPVAGITGNYSYDVGSPGTNTSFTINSIAFTANTGGNASSGTAGTAGAVPTSPDAAVNMVTALAGVAGSAGSTGSGGNGGGLYGGAGSGSGNGTNGGVGSGGGGCRLANTRGTGGNGLIVATWYYKNPNISLTNYTNGPGSYA